MLARLIRISRLKMVSEICAQLMHFVLQGSNIFAFIRYSGNKFVRLDVLLPAQWSQGMGNCVKNSCLLCFLCFKVPILVLPS